MIRRLLYSGLLGLVAVCCGCQQWGPTGAQRPGGLGNPSGTFAGSWNGGWNRNWNTVPGSPGPAFGNFGGRNSAQLQAQSAEANRRMAELNEQIRTLQSRVGGFDSDNNGLHSEIASLKQQLQRTTDANTQLRQQLGQMATNVQQLQTLKGQLEQELVQSKTESQRLANSNSRVPTQNASSPTLRANNSLMSRLPQLRIDGAQTRMDGDVIRIELPSDRIFIPGTYQINVQAGQTIANIGSSISRSFPNQRIAIESHWDRSPIQGGVTDHQVTATQSLAVLNQLVQVGLPRTQLFTVAMASSLPRYQGNNSLNRRIEIVIYPETFSR